MSSNDKGVWVAHTGDWSEVHIMASHRKALERAVPNRMDVTFVEYGDPILTVAADQRVAVRVWWKQLWHMRVSVRFVRIPADDP
jgi:hypothetical protein